MKPDGALLLLNDVTRDMDYIDLYRFSGWEAPSEPLLDETGLSVYSNRWNFCKRFFQSLESRLTDWP